MTCIRWYILTDEDELWAQEGIFLSDEIYRLLYNCQRTHVGEEHVVDMTGLENAQVDRKKGPTSDNGWK
jgi:hypothetical protein